MSSFSPPARCGVGFCWASSGVDSVPLPGAPAVFGGVSCRWLPLAGSATFLAPVSWLTPAVETCWWVGGVFGRYPTWFSTLCHALPPGPAVCTAFPWGVFCLFCHRVPDLLLLWWRRLGGNPSLIFLCFSCAGWFAGVCWVLHPVSGTSRWGCVCSLGDSVMTLLAFPYFRVGALLAWGVYGVSCCEVCSLGCPSWLVLLFMSRFFLHLLLGWGGLVTGLWPHLQLLCVGLFWGLGCAVLSP